MTREWPSPWSGLLQCAALSGLVHINVHGLLVSPGQSVSVKFTSLILTLHVFKNYEVQKILTMASEQTRHAYKEDDKLDERLLNQISKWIYYHRLPSLARHLGISDAEITRIMIPSRTPEEQCFQVRFLFILR